MTKARLTDSQIIVIFKQAEGGAANLELCKAGAQKSERRAGLKAEVLVEAEVKTC